MWVGLFAAMLGGALMAALLAVLAIRYKVNQIIAGHRDQHPGNWVDQLLQL